MTFWRLFTLSTQCLFCSKGMGRRERRGEALYSRSHPLRALGGNSKTSVKQKQVMGKEDWLSLSSCIYFFFLFVPVSSFFSHCLNDSWFIMFCQFLLYGKVSHSYMNIYIPVIYTYMCIHTHTHTHTHPFSRVILHHVLLQVTAYSSLCYLAGSHCLPTPNTIVFIY